MGSKEHNFMAIQYVINTSSSSDLFTSKRCQMMLLSWIQSVPLLQDDILFLLTSSRTPKHTQRLKNSLKWIRVCKVVEMGMEADERKKVWELRMFKQGPNPKIRVCTLSIYAQRSWGNAEHSGSTSKFTKMPLRAKMQQFSYQGLKGK